MAELKNHIPRDENFVAASVMYTYNESTGEYIPYNNVSTAISTGQITVGTNAVQGPDLPCKYVILMNYTSDSILFLGSSNAVTTSTGFGALNNLDVSAPLNISNLNLLFLVSSKANTDVRYLVGL